MTRAAACISSHCASHLNVVGEAATLHNAWCTTLSKGSCPAQQCRHCCWRAGTHCAPTPQGSPPHCLPANPPSAPQDLCLVKQNALSGAEVAVPVNLFAAPPARTQGVAVPQLDNRGASPQAHRQHTHCSRSPAQCNTGSTTQLLWQRTSTSRRRSRRMTSCCSPPPSESPCHSVGTSSPSSALGNSQSNVVFEHSRVGIAASHKLCGWWHLQAAPLPLTTKLPAPGDIAQDRQHLQLCTTLQLTV